MANSMDKIVVKYGVSVVDGEDFKEREKKLQRAKTVSITDFFKVSPDELTETERKVQNALKLIYELNEKDPPLFQKFPDFRSDERPLTINLTSAEKDQENVWAAFIPVDNSIIFQRAQDPVSLISTLAHELKHAEQCDEEVYKKVFGWQDSYELQQLNFLQEAQAYAFGGRVSYEIYGKAEDEETELYKKVSEKYTDANGHKDIQKIEEEMICTFLDKLYSNWNGYKTDFDLDNPIGENDKGMDHIPEIFHLSQSLMEKLNKAPKFATSPLGMIVQARKNRNKDYYMHLLRKGISRDGKGDVDGCSLIKNLKQRMILAQMYGDELKDKEKVFVFSYSNDAESLWKLLEENRNKKNFGSMIAKAFCNRIEDTPDNFEAFVEMVKDENGCLPFKHRDLIERDGAKRNKLVYNWVNGENLSILLKLRGSDGKHLIGLKDLISVFVNCVDEAKDPNKIQDIFDSVKGKSGNFLFQRESFENFMNENELLEEMKASFDSNEKDKEDVLKKLEIIMKWKDCDGLPIVSKENIEAIIDNVNVCRDFDPYNISENDIKFAEFAKAYMKATTPKKKSASLKNVLKQSQDEKTSKKTPKSKNLELIEKIKEKINKKSRV